jgi:hypothetical protein
MNEQEMLQNESDASKQVWVFNGNRNHFPSAVFSERALAEEWILKNGLSGTLTAYPIDGPVYEWVIAQGYWHPTTEEHRRPNYIANFSSADLEHYHYEDGQGGC